MEIYYLRIIRIDYSYIDKAIVLVPLMGGGANKE